MATHTGAAAGSITLRRVMSAFLLLAFATTARAHGGHEEVPEGEAVSTEPMDSTLWAHILVMGFAWGIVFPVGMVLGLAKSRWHVPTQILGSALATLGYFLGHLHRGRQFGPNAHAGFANWLMLLLIAQGSLGLYLKLHLERGFLGIVRRGLVRVHAILGGILPVAAWVQMLLGGIASQGYCQEDHLGQCLAHFIMGSAFIGYGIVLTILLLNGQPFLARTGRSQEFWDSVVISVWGCINTFTEHRWGGPWVRNDLQHTSMGIIWWAAGLVGIWLSRDREGRPKRNLIPGIVIAMTGWAMSSHPQDLMISTMIHAVFGYTLMGAGLTRIIEISFVLRDQPTLSSPQETAVNSDRAVNSFQYLPVFLLYAGGMLFMGATEEQMQALHDNHVTHVSYVLILYSISFVMLLFVLMLLQMYTSLTAAASASLPPARHADDVDDAERSARRPQLNGHIVTAADRQAHDAQEFELEGLMSDDDEVANGKPNGGAVQLR